MTTAATQNWPTVLWKPENIDVICRTIIGLQEKLDDQIARVYKAAFAVLTCLFISVGIGLSPLGFVATTLFVGAGVVGAVVSLALLIHTITIKSKINTWLFAFNNLAENRIVEVEKLFADQMQTNENGNLELQPLARKTLACLEPQYGSIFDKTDGNNASPPERSVGHAWLMIACHKANANDQPKDWSTRSQTEKVWNDHLNVCQQFLSYPYHGFNNCDPLEVIEDLRTKHPSLITIPSIKSPGHGLLLTIVNWTEKFKSYDFDEMGNLINHKGCHFEYLKGWEVSVRKCQEWMRRKSAFGVLEQHVVKSLLEAKNMRDFVHVLNRLSAEDRQKLQNTI